MRTGSTLSTAGILITCLVVRPGVAPAQTTDSASIAACLLADSIASAGRPVDTGRALSDCLRASRTLRARHDWAGASTSLASAAWFSSLLGRDSTAVGLYLDAARFARRGGAPARAVARFSDAGNLLRQLRLADSARATYLAALSFAVPDSLSAVRTMPLNGLGLLEYDANRPHQALRWYRRALPLVPSGEDTDILYSRGDLFNNLGAAHGVLGEADSAAYYYHRALTTLRQLGDTATQLTTLGNLSVLLRTVGRRDAARGVADSALALAVAISDSAGIIRALNMLGLLSLDDSLRQDAAAHFTEALAIAEQLHDSATQAILLNHLGIIDRYEGSRPAALDRYDEALRLQRALHDARGEGWTLNNIGLVLTDLGQTTDAVRHYRNALAIRVKQRDAEGEWQTLQNLGDAYLRQGDRAGATSALSAYRRAIGVLQGVRRHAGGDAERLSFAEQSSPRLLFEGAIRARLHLGGSATAEGALALAEQGRAQALLALLRERPANRPASETDPGSQLRAVGGPGRAILIYAFVGDTLAMWMSRPGRALLFDTVAVSRDSLTGWIAALRRGIRVDSARDGDDEEYPLRSGASGAAPSEGTFDPTVLSARLLPPRISASLAAVHELVVVPAGPLNLVPFAALRVPGTGEWLGSRVALRYAPSLAALATLERRGPPAGPEPGSKALIVGDPAMPEITRRNGTRDRLGPLPGAQREAAAVAAAVAAPWLTGEAASETAVRLRLPGANVVLLATHGLAYSAEARARDSFIALAPDSANDGILTVGEVLDDPTLSLRAELVTLSACQTGLGNLKQAEGTVGLQRAFLARGARSVLVSLWSVSDASTELLMRQFYRLWLEPGAHRSKAEALKMAQDSVRADSRFAEPRFWAAFQLVGAR